MIASPAALFGYHGVAADAIGYKCFGFYPKIIQRVLNTGHQMLEKASAKQVAQAVEYVKNRPEFRTVLVAFVKRQFSSPSVSKKESLIPVFATKSLI